MLIYQVRIVKFFIRFFSLISKSLNLGLETNTQQNLRHLTRNRVAVPKQKRRLPSKFNSQNQSENNSITITTSESIVETKNIKKDSKKEFNNSKSKFESKKFGV